MISLAEWCKSNDRQDIIDKWSERNTISPFDLGYSSAKKVLWKCDKGHTWEATPNKMVRRTSLGCPYCANQKIIAGFNDLQSKNPEIANEWHPTKNGALQPNEVAEHSNKYVWWLCPKGHEYKAMINMRTGDNRKRGCPFCANKRILRGFNDLETICPEIAAEWHPTKNGNLKPCDVGAGSSREVWWKCPLGHEYKASLNSRVIKGKPKNGCPVCANKVILIGYNDLGTLFPYIAKEWDVKKNDGLLPSDIIPGSHKKYWWICPFGHSYQASPENRTKEKGTGCPICAKEQQSSFPEQAIFYYLKRQFSNAENRFILFGKEIDIYIPDLKIGIEYDGYRWHDQKTRNKEIEKDKFFAEKGIRIIRIKEFRTKEEVLQLSDTIWINERDNQFQNIVSVLNKIASIIDFIPIYQIKLECDNIAIMDMYISSKKANSLQSLRPDIAKEWCDSLNGSITPEMVSVNSGKKFWWGCAIGHRYQMSVNSRTGKGTGCPYCAGQKVLTGFNDLQTRYPEIAAEWHPINNGDMTPDEVMPGSHTKVWWLCKENHEYYTSIASRTNRKSGCPFCAGKIAITGTTDLKTQYPKIAGEWDYNKNGDLIPENVKPFSHKKVWWLCPKGHSYETAISNRTINSKNDKNTGCPYCSGQKTLAGFNDFKTLFPEIAAKWHPTLNKELSPSEVRLYSTQKVWWIDDDGNEYQRRIDSEVMMYRKNHPDTASV